MRRAYVLVAIVAIGVLLGGVSKTSPATDENTEDGFIALFNGEDLTGWTGDKIGHRVEEGVLVANPLGNLYTETEYDDFIFRFEFKLTPGANNGIGIRVPMKGKASSEGMEIQILDDTADKYADVNPWQRHGSIYGVVPATPGHLKPVGEWNMQEIHVQGTQVRVVLNDAVIVDADLAPFRDGAPAPDGKEHPGLLRNRGHISLAGHNTKVLFRNLAIKPLQGDKKSKTPETP